MKRDILENASKEYMSVCVISILKLQDKGKVYKEVRKRK